jgi:lycopene cyclase CruA
MTEPQPHPVGPATAADATPATPEATEAAAPAGASHDQLVAWAVAAGLRDLDLRWQALHRAPAAVLGQTSHLPALDSEILVLGGGLGLIAATVLAQRGHSVRLIDRRRVGHTHREWNSSQAELAVLRHLGLPLEGALAREYQRGFVEFAAPAGAAPERVWLPGVLDVAVASDQLLANCRAAFLAAGGQLYEDEHFERLKNAPNGVLVETSGGQHRARVVLDALGVLSPIQFALHQRPFDWVCPTAGSVVRGLAGVDPDVGEVLYTNSHGQAGRQYIWELFPLEANAAPASAVYLFHYAPIGEEGTLEQLFGEYLRLLPSYHDDANAQHLKPVFGYIPSRHQRRSASLARVVPLGDAAAWSSPLTFTGFGSFVRNLPRVVALLETALRNDNLEAADTAQISARQSNLELLWSLAHFMRPLSDDSASVGRIMNAFNRASNRLGPARAKRFYQDRAGVADFIAILASIMLDYPDVWRHGLKQLGLRQLARLLASIPLAALRETLAWLAYNSEGHAFRASPSQQLHWQALSLEHQAMKKLG